MHHTSRSEFLKLSIVVTYVTHSSSSRLLLVDPECAIAVQYSLLSTDHIHVSREKRKLRNDQTRSLPEKRLPAYKSYIQVQTAAHIAIPVMCGGEY